MHSLPIRVYPLTQSREHELAFRSNSFERDAAVNWFIVPVNVHSFIHGFLSGLM